LSFDGSQEKIKKPQQNRMSSPKAPKIPRNKTNKQLNIKDLHPKNKSAKVGILVPLNSIQ
jgi:hypothetical protein